MLKERLRELVAACFSGIWIETHEFQVAINDIAQLCRDENWRFASWDINRGLCVDGAENTVDATDPLAAIRGISAIGTPEGTVILVMNNLHKFIASTEVLQALQHQLLSGKQNRTIVIGLSPHATIPPELEKLFVVIEHMLPDRDQLEEIVRGIATEEGELPDESGLQTVLDAAIGLTRLAS